METRAYEGGRNKHALDSQKQNTPFINEIKKEVLSQIVHILNEQILRLAFCDSLQLVPF